MAEEKTPPLQREVLPFTERRKELTKPDVNLNRELYLARIHVEYVTGVLKKKSNLPQNIPISLIHDQRHQVYYI